MNPLGSLPSTASLAGDLAADSRSLDQLKREAGRDPRQAVKAAAKQFEAMFMQMVLKSMREATPKSGLLDSSAGDLYGGMLDQQLAGSVAGSSGLAAMIERQLSRHLQPSPGVSDQGELRKRPIEPAGGLRPAARAAPESAMGSAARQSRTLNGAAEDGKTPETPSQTAGEAGGAAQRVFVNRMWDHALLAQRETGLPAKFIIGQAALESGWGGREIVGTDGMRSFNLFGIKAGGGWQGRTVEAMTTEYENGVAVRKVEKFRAYNSYGEAFRDWARLLSANPRYADVLASGTTAAGFAHGLQRAGYATDPNYGAKLQRVIETANALRRHG